MRLYNNVSSLMDLVVVEGRNGTLFYMTRKPSSRRFEPVSTSILIGSALGSVGGYAGIATSTLWGGALIGAGIGAGAGGLFAAGTKAMKDMKPSIPGVTAVKPSVTAGAVLPQSSEQEKINKRAAASLLAKDWTKATLGQRGLL